MTALFSEALSEPVSPLTLAPPRRRTTHSHSDGSDARSVAVGGLGRAIRVKLASDRDEFEQAFRLVADRYKARGYDAPGAGPYRYTPYHALPGTVTFVAKDGDRVVATLTLVPDNETLGLPMESIYGEEIAALRWEGRTLGEVTCLAEEGLNPREFLKVFSVMIRVMFQYHVRRGGDTWVITVNPRHRSYYTKVLGFVPLGPCRTYSSVGDAPAEAFYLDVDLMQEGAPEKHREVFGEVLPWQVVTPFAKSADHALYFGPRSTQADFRTILKVLAAGKSRSGRPTLRVVAADPGPAGDGFSEATGPCGSWRSKRCSPTGAGF
jgi:hypothetical protein